MFHAISKTFTSALIGISLLTVGISTTATAGDDHAASLAAVIAGEHRSEGDKARDQFRHPAETIAFFGIEPSMSVVEIWPGGGYYFNILAPWITEGGGTYYAAQGWRASDERERVQEAIKNFDETLAASPDLYGGAKRSLMHPQEYNMAPDGPVDVVLTFRNVHNWMTGDPETDYSAKTFKAMYDALKPGGILGVVEHRAKGSEQDPAATSGYVLESHVIAMATEAGFVLEAQSEINANPKDTTDHPFGVWTLPPVKRTSAFGEDANPDFDRTKYDAIGESDRMTLKFRKPE